MKSNKKKRLHIFEILQAQINPRKTLAHPRSPQTSKLESFATVENIPKNFPRSFPCNSWPDSSVG